MSSLEPGSSAKASAPPPVTPDGRYIVVRGRLWRRANPDLDAEQRRALTADLMRARRAVGAALRAHDDAALAAARAQLGALLCQPERHDVELAAVEGRRLRQRAVIEEDRVVIARAKAS